MKILFTMSSPEYLRFYDGTILELAGRGHEVAIAVNAVRQGKPVRVEAITSLHPKVTYAGTIPVRDDMWAPLARALRGTMDFVRYLHPSLSGAAALRARVRRQALPWVLGPLDRVAKMTPERVRSVLQALATADEALPIPRSVRSFLSAHPADLVLVSPLVEPASEQVDLVRAAQASGTRVATLVASWDNLTNKGDLRVSTGMVAVWNEAQKQEAIELHRIPAENVVVTGAQVFDRWFDRAPERSRDAFCRQVGLPADKPFVLFTGSSIFIARADAEMPFVRRWIESLRASTEPAVRDLSILVRPHPYNGRAWNAEAFDGMPDVAVWPRGGYDPVDEQNRAGLFDSLYHCAAVVGINTSAMIEAAVVGRPVFSIQAPEFAGTQEGTLHYRYLLPENGGFLRVASTFDDHVAQLAGVLAEPEATRRQLQRFVSSFVRPHGSDRTPTLLLADAIEHYGGTPPVSRRTAAALALAVRACALPLVPVAMMAPPEAMRRWTAARISREGWHRVRRAVRRAHGGLRRGIGSVESVGGQASRGARRSFIPLRRRAARLLRLPGRAYRSTRFRAGTMARRLRGAPLD